MDFKYKVGYHMPLEDEADHEEYPLINTIEYIKMAREEMNRENKKLLFIDELGDR